MKTSLFRLVLPVILLFNIGAQVTPGLYVTTPVEGQVVAGTVEIKGSVPDTSFLYAEVSYAFDDGQNTNWFLIKRIEEPIHDGLLAMWDTTTITDGVYRLRLSVHEKNEDVHELILENIKVGNYTHYEVTTPTTPVNEIQATEEITSTPTPQQTPEPTELPKNPASIDEKDIRASLTSGLVLTILALVILGIYAYFRQKARK